MKFKLFNTLGFALLIAGMLLIILGDPFDISPLISLGTAAIFLASVFLLILKFFFEGKAMTLSDIIFIFLAIFAIGAFIYAGELSYAKAVPLICFLEIPILMSAVDVNRKKIKNVIYYTFYFISFFYVFLSLTGKAYIYVGPYAVTNISALTLGYSNPNHTAILLIFAMFVLLTGVFDEIPKIFKFLFSINAIVLLYLIFKTQSRTGLILAVLFIILLIFKKQKSLNKFLSSFGVFIPSLFALFLLFASNIYADIELFGDSFDTGRNVIYSTVLKSLDSIEDWLLGNYKQYASQNLHNSAISLLVEFGILAFIIFTVFLHIKSKSSYSEAKNNCENTALLALFFIIIYSSSEAAFFIAGSFYAVSTFILYYLSLPTLEEPKKNAKIKSNQDSIL